MLAVADAIFINRNSVPAGELVPLRRHRFVAAAAAVPMFKNAPQVDYDLLRRDLDVSADQELPDRV